MSNQPSAESDSKPDLLMCILSYLGIFALIPYVVKKDDPYIAWHARQGVVWLICCVFVMLGFFVLSLIPFLNLLILPLGGLVFLAMLGVSVFCMIQASQGRKWQIPFIAKFMDKVPLPK